MAVRNLFGTTTSTETPLSGSVAPAGTAVSNTTTATVSDFLTIQSLANFSAMTGAFTIAWNALQKLDADRFSGLWVPYVLAGIFAIVSLVTSLEGLKKNGELQPGQILSAAFIAFLNALVLASAVVGAESVTTDEANATGL